MRPFVWCMPKVKDAVRLVEGDWILVRTKGSHRQYRHASKLGTVTIAGRMSKDLAPGTWANIVKQAGLQGGD